MQQVWRIVDFDMVPVERNQIGQFFGGDCYVILYTYKVQNKENYIVYYWQVVVIAIACLECPDLCNFTNR